MTPAHGTTPRSVFSARDASPLADTPQDHPRLRDADLKMACLDDHRVRNDTGR